MDQDSMLTRRATLARSIEDRIARMWLEAEKPIGADASAFFTIDGVFEIDDLVYAKGRDAIRTVGSHRELIGPRVSRHLMSNYAFEPEDLDAGVRIASRAVMTHFGGTGTAPLTLGLPLGIYDVRLIAVRQSDGAWLLEQWRMSPAFLAPDHPAFTMPRALSHPEAPADATR